MMTNMAMQYGQTVMNQGSEEFKKNIDRYVSIGQLRYYFAVDTAYVGRKLGKRAQHYLPAQFKLY